MTANGFAYDVFLSHSSRDKAVVRPLAEFLRGDGLNIWFDEWVIKPGDNIPAKIEEGLEKSRILVLCMSKNAFGADWVKLEAGTFRFRDPMNNDRRFIPLRLDRAPIKGSLAQFLYISCLPADIELARTKLITACRRNEPLEDAQKAAVGWASPAPKNIAADRSSRDDFPNRAKVTLAHRVGMRCSNPNCRRTTSGPQSDPSKVVNIGIAAHITAASKNGPRFDPKLSNEKRSSIGNGIWLCQNCAKLVDNDYQRYTIQVLYEWKRQAESDAQRNLEGSRVPSRQRRTDPTPQSGRALRELPLKAAKPDRCPFHPTGAMGLHEPSYIVRSCDAELKEAAASHVFVWIQGGFQYGKSSLMRRHRLWLGADWLAVYIDLQGFDRSTDFKFRRDLFSEFEEVLGGKVDWRSLGNSLKRQKIAFLLDEFGACAHNQIKELLEHFHSLAENNPGNFKLVATYKESPRECIPKSSIQNPKYENSWKIVPISVLTPREIGKLVALFPDATAFLIRKRLDRIRTLTGFEPGRVQRILMGLWSRFEGSQSSPKASQSLVDRWLDSEEI